VDTLSVPYNASINLNGLTLYARLASVSGSVTNGIFLQTPSGGGAATFGAAMASDIRTNGTQDQWTFYGRAGQSITITVDAESSSIPYPQMNWARFELIGPGGVILAQASNTIAAVPATLLRIPLPSDGSYRVAVGALYGGGGDYQITIWDSTPKTHALVYNQIANGEISSPYGADSWTFTAAAGQSLKFNLINTSATGLGFALTGPNGWVGFSNLMASSGLLTLPAGGEYTAEVSGPGGNYGIAYAFELLPTAQTNLGLSEPFVGTLLGSGEAQLFVFQVSNTMPMRISLALGQTGENVELYAKYGSPPTRADYDYKYFGPPSQNENILVPEPAEGAWYVLVYSDFVPAPTSYTLEAIQQSIFLEGAFPATNVMLFNSVVELTGAGFNSGTAIMLESGGVGTMATNLEVVSDTRMNVFIPSNSLAAGIYDICASSGLDSVCLTNAMTMLAAGTALLQTSVTVPDAIGYHEFATLLVNYANTGTAPMSAPLLTLRPVQNGAAGSMLTMNESLVSEIPGIESAFLANYANTKEPPGFSASAQILGSGTEPGVLAPGESVSVPVYYAGWLHPWDFSYPPIKFALSVQTTDSTNAIDWTVFGQQIRPPGIDDATWASELDALEDLIGPSWGGYVAALNENAIEMAELGVTNITVPSLFAQEFQRAEGNGVQGISGVVLDNVTSRPLAGVVVHDLSQNLASVARATTDAAGRFILTGLQNGIQQLSLDGYFIVSNADVFLTNDSNVTGLRLLATEAAHITGHVTSVASGLALTNVPVICASETTNFSIKVVTDATGFYAFSTLPADSYALSCSPKNFGSNNIAGIAISLGQTQSNVDFNLQSAGTLSGIVLQAADSNVVSGVTVYLQGQNGFIQAATTGNNGSYQFTALPAGSYNIEYLINGEVFQSASNRSRVNGDWHQCHTERSNVIGDSQRWLDAHP
jgi:hypothetical protein